MNNADLSLCFIYKVSELLDFFLPSHSLVNVSQPHYGSRWWLYQQVALTTQNAVQRLLTFMLDEYCCWIGLLGLQSVLLFGSDILTCEIATARASINPQSCFSDLPLSVSYDKFRLE